MDVDLFAGVAVSDLPARCQLVRPILRRGRVVRATERVRTVSEHRHLYVELRPEHAGTPRHSVRRRLRRVRDAVAQRGIILDTQETYRNAYARPHVATRTATRSVSAAPVDASEPPHPSLERFRADTSSSGEPRCWLVVLEMRLHRRGWPAGSCAPLRTSEMCE